MTPAGGGSSDKMYGAFSEYTVAFSSFVIPNNACV